jgi:hypothetical protein
MATLAPDALHGLDESLRVEFGEANWFFIADYYDGPISGLAYFRKTLHRFCCFPDDIPDHFVYVLHELSEAEQVELLRQKEKFEQMVGTHWSFDVDGQPLALVTLAPALSQQYYAEEKYVSVWPDERPIVAWFRL